VSEPTGAAGEIAMYGTDDCLAGVQLRAIEGSAGLPIGGSEDRYTQFDVSRKSADAMAAGAMDQADPEQIAKVSFEFGTSGGSGKDA
jgi:hypothetical protein